MCEKNGKFQRYIYCPDDEWCVGPTDSTNFTYEVDSLCVKGNTGDRCLEN